jgi:hypothetical protein
VSISPGAVVTASVTVSNSVSVADIAAGVAIVEPTRYSAAWMSAPPVDVSSTVAVSV